MVTAVRMVKLGAMARAVRIALVAIVAPRESFGALEPASVVVGFALVLSAVKTTKFLALMVVARTSAATTMEISFGTIARVAVRLLLGVPTATSATTIQMFLETMLALPAILIQMFQVMMTAMYATRLPTMATILTMTATYAMIRIMPRTQLTKKKRTTLAIRARIRLPEPKTTIVIDAI